MKTKILLSAILAFFVLITYAQDEEQMKTVFNKSDGKIDHGGYGAVTIGYSKIDGKDGMLIGGRAGWLIDHRLTLGLVGYGFFNNLQKNYDYQASEYTLAGGYGGLFLEPIILNKKPVHLTVPLIFAVGGITAMDDYWSNNYYHNTYNYDYYNSDVFLVFEPGLEVEINILRFFRIAVGGSYRWTNGINLTYYYEEYVGDDLITGSVPVTKNALDGFTFNMSFKFGWF